MSGVDTRQRLEAAALAALRLDGLAAVSARTIAGRAGVNQALIFYHYDSVANLVRVAALASVTAAVERHRTALEAAESFADLFAAGKQLDEQERDAGNVAVMSQLLSGAQFDQHIGACARDCLAQWISALQPVVERLLRRSPLAGLVEPRGLARAISAAFIGLELYEGADPEGAGLAVASLDQLGAVLTAIDALSPVTRRTVRAHLRRRIASRGTRPGSA